VTTVVKHVRWYLFPLGLWCHDEIDDDNTSWRHVEYDPDQGIYAAAASLTEALHARDTGGIDAVRAYEHRYGVAPEGPVPGDTDDERHQLEVITAEEFERVWREAREAREKN
jgi:hypothetical protein